MVTPPSPLYPVGSRGLDPSLLPQADGIPCSHLPPTAWEKTMRWERSGATGASVRERSRALVGETDVGEAEMVEKKVWKEWV